MIAVLQANDLLEGNLSVNDSIRRIHENSLTHCACIGTFRSRRTRAFAGDRIARLTIAIALLLAAVAPSAIRTRILADRPRISAQALAAGLAAIAASYSKPNLFCYIATHNFLSSRLTSRGISLWSWRWVLIKLVPFIMR